jgi:hypothetical protein
MKCDHCGVKRFVCLMYNVLNIQVSSIISISDDVHVVLTLTLMVLIVEQKLPTLPGNTS